MRLARPKALVDLNRIPGMSGIRADDGRIVIGAMTRQRDVERSETVARSQPLLHEAVTLIAHPQIRNRGTVGGSLAHADPAAELPAAALALDAEFVATGPNGSRRIPAGEFFVTFLTTALEPNEVLTEISFPKAQPGTGSSVKEVARRHGDFALAGAAVTLTLDGDRCSDARIALFGVGYAPVRATDAEELLRGETATESALDAAAGKASDVVEEPIGDIHASSDFRRHLAKVMTRRALTEAVARARNGGTHA
jgi:carbon-monoxide dehydrogenase medium subunit